MSQKVGSFDDLFENPIFSWELGIFLKMVFCEIFCEIDIFLEMIEYYMGLLGKMDISTEFGPV